MSATSNTMPKVTEDLLSQLRDIHLPEPIGLWPLAPGWWILAGLLCALAVVACLYVTWRRRSLAHHALAELDGLENDPATGQDLQAYATAVSALLRRVALQRFERDQVSHLTGSAWQGFLSQNVRSENLKAELAGEVGQLLAVAPYAPPGTDQITCYRQSTSRARLTAVARSWIRQNA